MSVVTEYKFKHKNHNQIQGTKIFSRKSCYMDRIIMAATEIHPQKQYEKGWWHKAKQVTETSQSLLKIVSDTFQDG